MQTRHKLSNRQPVDYVFIIDNYIQPAIAIAMAIVVVDDDFVVVAVNR